MPAPAAEIWNCPHCNTPVDITSVGFCETVACPNCGQSETVHTLLANFTLESVLGIGGMSTVYRARDMVLNRTLAIKVLHDSDLMDSEESRARFETEGSLMAKVRHENVVSVYSAGWAHGHFYLAMELVEGTNMELLVTERKCLLPGEALELIRQVALGLQAAHAVGVLHRDVKPGNVLITAGGTAKVLDFGLALEDKPMEENDGIIWATPFYVPPETLRREKEDARSDIYALGMTLRHLLTGSDKLGDPAPQSISELLDAKKDLPSFAAHYPKLGESLGELIDHMTAFDPADRPASYAEVLEEMAEVQARIGRAGLRGISRRQDERRKAMGICAAVCAVAGLALAAVVALTGPMQYDYAALTPPADPLWEEWQAYEEAHAAMHAHETEEAAQRFAALASRTTDPALGAACAYHAHALALLSNMSEEDVQEILTQAQTEKHMTSRTAPMPALLSTYAALRTPSNRLEEIPAGLRAALAVIRAHGRASAGKDDEAKEWLTIAQAAAADENACCREGMKSALAAFAERMPRLAAEEQRKRLRQALKLGQFSVARAYIRELEDAPLSPLEKQELSVQSELCEVGDTLYDLLKRRCKDKFRADATPDELAALAADVAPGTFRVEVLTIACLLRGDYSRAFLTNPYRNTPDSQEPLAVLLRDWKKRLGR